MSLSWSASIPSLFCFQPNLIELMSAYPCLYSSSIVDSAITSFWLCFQHTPKPAFAKVTRDFHVVKSKGCTSLLSTAAHTGVPGHKMYCFTFSSLPFLFQQQLLSVHWLPRLLCELNVIVPQGTVTSDMFLLCPWVTPPTSLLHRGPHPRPRHRASHLDQPVVS